MTDAMADERNDFADKFENDLGGSESVEQVKSSEDYFEDFDGVHVDSTGDFEDDETHTNDNEQSTDVVSVSNASMQADETYDSDGEYDSESSAFSDSSSDSSSGEDSSSDPDEETFIKEDPQSESNGTSGDLFSMEDYEFEDATEEDKDQLPWNLQYQLLTARERKSSGRPRSPVHGVVRPVSRLNNVTSIDEAATLDTKSSNEGSTLDPQKVEKIPSTPPHTRHSRGRHSPLSLDLNRKGLSTRPGVPKPDSPDPRNVIQVTETIKEEDEDISEAAKAEAQRQRELALTIFPDKHEKLCKPTPRFELPMDAHARAKRRLNFFQSTSPYKQGVDNWYSLGNREVIEQMDYAVQLRAQRDEFYHQVRSLYSSKSDALEQVSTLDSANRDALEQVQKLEKQLESSESGNELLRRSLEDEFEAHDEDVQGLRRQLEGKEEAWKQEFEVKVAELEKTFQHKLDVLGHKANHYQAADSGVQDNSPVAAGDMISQNNWKIRGLDGVPEFILRHLKTIESESEPKLPTIAQIQEQLSKTRSFPELCLFLWSLDVNVQFCKLADMLHKRQHLGAVSKVFAPVVTRLVDTLEQKLVEKTKHAETVIAELTKTTRALQEENAKLAEAKWNVENDLSVLASERAGETEAFRETIATLREENAQLLETKKALETRLTQTPTAELLAEKAQLAARISSLRAENINLADSRLALEGGFNDKVAGLQAENGELITMIESLQEELDGLRNDNADKGFAAEGAMTMLEVQWQTLRSDMAELSDQVIMDKSASKTRATNGTARPDEEEHSRNLIQRAKSTERLENNLKGIIQMYKGSNNAAEKAILPSNLETLEADNKSLKALVEALKAEVQALKAKISQLETDSTKVPDAKVEELRSQNTALVEAIKSDKFGAMLERAGHENQSLVASLATKAAELAAKDEELARQKAEIQALRDVAAAAASSTSTSTGPSSVKSDDETYPYTPATPTQAHWNPTNTPTHSTTPKFPTRASPATIAHAVDAFLADYHPHPFLPRDHHLNQPLQSRAQLIAAETAHQAAVEAVLRQRDERLERFAAEKAERDEERARLWASFEHSCGRIRGVLKGLGEPYRLGTRDGRRDEWRGMGRSRVGSSRSSVYEDGDERSPISGLARPKVQRYGR